MKILTLKSLIQQIMRNEKNILITYLKNYNVSRDYLKEIVISLSEMIG